MHNSSIICTMWEHNRRKCCAQFFKFLHMIPPTTDIPKRQAVVADECVALADQERSISEKWIFMKEFLGQFPTADPFSVKPFLTEVHLLTGQILLRTSHDMQLLNSTSDITIETPQKSTYCRRDQQSPTIWLDLCPVVLLLFALGKIIILLLPLPLAPLST